MYYDISTKIPSPFVPVIFRRQVFDRFHRVTHQFINATMKLISKRSLKADCGNWARSCFECQTLVNMCCDLSSVFHKWSANVFPMSIYFEIILPLPSCDGFSFCLTMIDHFTTTNDRPIFENWRNYWEYKNVVRLRITMWLMVSSPDYINTDAIKCR